MNNVIKFPILKNQSLKKIAKDFFEKNTCRWPVGEPKHADFYFCGEKNVIGKSYCDEHCRVAYVNFRSKAPDRDNEE